MLLVFFSLMMLAGMAWAVSVASNALLSERATSLRTLLNSSHNLRLFKNDLTPTPVNVLVDFTQANYTGYEGPVSLASQFGSPAKIQDGEYQFDSSTYTFAYHSGSSQTIYGWYIDDGTNVKFSQRFSSPIVLEAGVQFTLTISPQDWAYSII